MRNKEYRNQKLGIRKQKLKTENLYFSLIFSVFFSFLISHFSFLLSTAFADDLDGIISKIQKTYEGIQDIQADFVQLTTSSATKETQKADGLVYFKKPGMMKWEYKSPTNDIIVSDGRTIWAYQQDIGQVMIGNASDSGASISNNFLAGMGNLKKDFDIELEKPDNNSYVLKLNPKIPQPNIQRLYIAVDKKTSLVKQTIVFDLLGNETKVIFENLKINQSVPANIFKFKIPEGVRVVKP